jgi:hypothetical protein
MKKLLLLEAFILEKSKKSKPKTDKQKIKDLAKKQKGLAKKSNDIKGDMLDLSKDKEKEPTDKLQSLLLKTQMQQTAADAQKAAVQIKQIGLKAKLKTAKKKEKAVKDLEKEKPKEKPVKEPAKTLANESYILEAEQSYNDYPAQAKKNAKMAIDWKEKYGRDEVTAGTAVGWARAHQLAGGEKLSVDTIARMSSFNRHRQNSDIAPEFKDTPWKDRGYVAWLIWGGDEGVDWAMNKIDEIYNK